MRQKRLQGWRAARMARGLHPSGANSETKRTRSTRRDFISLPKRRMNMETLLLTTPVFAAIGYSLVYLLAGGGLLGAFVIFVVAKMLGQ
jgi:hypothetical protein